ncbi:MAG: DUF1700 domain-containing protein [Lachnospiraceae bacterium]|jgi:hypothetical protein|nr:DUF1700 domain-containing protein [Lachnospiraceae bacterium]
MDKKEFLEKLALALAGQVSRPVIEENIRYYDDYITERLKKGIALSDVLEELGDPRLIAKSIIDANGGGDEMAGVYEDSDNGQQAFGSRAAGDDGFENRQGGFRSFRFNGLWALLLLLAVIFCILMVVGTVIGGIFLLLRPILVPVLIFFLIYSLIKGNRKY